MRFEKRKIPWWAVYLSILLLFPVGIIVLIIKLVREKEHKEMNARPLIWLGILFLICAAYYIYQFAKGQLPATVGSDPVKSMIVFLSEYLGGAAMFFVLGIVYKKKGRENLLLQTANREAEGDIDSNGNIVQLLPVSDRSADSSSEENDESSIKNA